jgi:methyl-accepting chemotaxis protein WspA
LHGKSAQDAKMKSLTIRWRIVCSFAVVLAVMTVMAGVGYTRLMHINAETTSLQGDTVPGLYFSTQLMTAWVIEHNLLAEHILENDPAQMRAAEEQLQANRITIQNFAKAYEGAIFQDEDRKNFAPLTALSSQYFATESDVLASSRINQNADALNLLQTRVDPIFAKIQASLQALVTFNKTHVDQSINQVLGAVYAAKLGIVITFAAAVLVAVLSGVWLFRAVTKPLGRLVSVVGVMGQGDFSQRLQTGRRDEFGTLVGGFNRMTDDLAALIGQVQKSTIQVNTSVTEIAATAKQQQATASEIAATTTEIGATSMEISATSKELVRTMDEVASVAEQTATLAGGGQTGVSSMEETMSQVMAAAGSINAKLGVLNEKAGNINQVVTTITKIADQTNLLSLNAAIEAEKAGEYGRGFAVVATEIRRLADLTAVATYDIEQMVKEIQSAVSASVMGMDKFSEEVRRGMLEVRQVGGQLSQIIQQVQELVPRFEVVNEGMQAQASGAGQISEALAQLGEAAQQTVESLRQSTAAISELNQVSSNLRGSISHFKLLGHSSD